MSSKQSKKPDPRNNADDAYKAFMSMGENEWRLLWESLTSGGVLQVEENKGYQRALKERGLPKKAPNKPPVNPKAAKAKGIKDTIVEPTGLAKMEPLDALQITYPQAIALAKDHIRYGLQAYTAAVALKDLKPIEVLEAHDYGASLMDAIDEAKGIARARVLDLGLAQGEPSGEKGLSRKMVIDGRLQNITIQKSGTDPKLFEAALRAKSATVSKYMEQVVTYKHSSTGVQASIDDGIFTQDEVDAMAHKPTYRVERSKAANDE